MQNDQQAARKAAVYEAALQLIGQGVSPAALKIQQLADAAGIGKGTVYEYFASKEEILQGLAEYCFARENERVRAMFADCTTLAGLEERITGYLQDIAASRMGSYKMIAKTLGMPRRTGAMPACMAELKEIVSELLARLQAAGEIAPELGMEYCYMSLLSAVVGGLMGLCYAADHDRTVEDLMDNLRLMIRRTLGK